LVICNFGARRRLETVVFGSLFTNYQLQISTVQLLNFEIVVNLRQTLGCEQKWAKSI
jgi:hypothetical protein